MLADCYLRFRCRERFCYASICRYVRRDEYVTRSWDCQTPAAAALQNLCHLCFSGGEKACSHLCQCLPSRR